MRWKWLSPRWHLRRWLGIHKLELATFDAGNRLDLCLERNVKHLRRKIDAIKSVGFLGLDLGYKEDSQIILLHYSVPTGSWKCIADTRFSKGNYPRLVRALRELCKEFNVQFACEDSYSGAPPIMSRCDVHTQEAMVALGEGEPPVPLASAGVDSVFKQHLGGPRE